MIDTQKQARFNALSEATKDALHCGNDFFVMKKVTEKMYEVYTSVSGITAGDFESREIMLESGRAISPASAAHCVLELKRTVIFLRGIFKAIKQCCKKNPDRPVSLFYAGCGPYAALINPLLSIFSPEELQVDILDINPVSLSSANEVVASLGFEKSVRSYILADAATISLPEGCDYDIAISETMQSCLENEPQVAIMQNLIPQLRENALFIPEKISLDAFLTDPKQEMDKFFHSESPKPPVERIPLGNIFTVDKESLATKEMRSIVTIPEDIATCVDLQIFTTVKVFGDEYLNENEASITMPKKFYEFQEQYAKKVRFWYENTSIPKIDCAVVEHA